MKKLMDLPGQEQKEAKRLEGVWAGSFGRRYLERNNKSSSKRNDFWRLFCKKYKFNNILEVGCNIGLNVKAIQEAAPKMSIFGVDINQQALEILKKNSPRINAVHSAARDLPFKDAYFDLVFTSGVLIHQPEAALPVVMSEIVRTSRRYVLCLEYYAKETIEVPYRGLKGALFKRDYGQLYRQLSPELRLRSEGFLPKKDGWDNITYWLFEKSE